MRVPFPPPPLGLGTSLGEGLSVGWEGSGIVAYARGRCEDVMRGQASARPTGRHARSTYQGCRTRRCGSYAEAERLGAESSGHGGDGTVMRVEIRRGRDADNVWTESRLGSALFSNPLRPPPSGMLMTHEGSSCSLMMSYHARSPDRVRVLSILSLGIFLPCGRLEYIPCV